MRALRMAVLSACLTASASAQSPSRDWRPTDRTVIGDFSRITSVAGGLDRVYATSLTSLLIWHPQTRQWEGPFDPPSRSVLSGVFMALVDPLDQSVWMARPEGWVHYQPELQLWEQGVVPEGVIGIAFDQTDPAGGLFIRSRGGWMVLPRGGFAPSPGRSPVQPIMAATVEEALRHNPSLQANAGQILLDSRLRTVRFTAAARSFDNLGWYLGTSGVGLLFMPDGAPLAERLPFGLPSPFVGALVSWPGGVWAATNRTPQADAAITFVSGDLREFRTVSGLPATGTPFDRVLELAGQGRNVWAATDHGVARVDPAEGRIDILDQAADFTDNRAFDIVGRQNGVTVGTARGVLRIFDSLHVERVAPRFGDPAYAVFPIGDTIWVGTPAGPFVALPGRDDLVRPPGVTSAALRVPILGFALAGDTLVGLTRDQMVWRDPRSGGWSLGPNLSGLLGRIRRFTPAGDGFWVAGDRGVGYTRLTGAPLLPVREGDLPGFATDLAVDREYLWVGTERGLVRFRLDAVRP